MFGYSFYLTINVLWVCIEIFVHVFNAWIVLESCKYCSPIVSNLLCIFQALLCLKMHKRDKQTSWATQIINFVHLIHWNIITVIVIVPSYHQIVLNRNLLETILSCILCAINVLYLVALYIQYIGYPSYILLNMIYKVKHINEDLLMTFLNNINSYSKYNSNVFVGHCVEILKLKKYGLLNYLFDICDTDNILKHKFIAILLSHTNCDLIGECLVNNIVTENQLYYYIKNHCIGHINSCDVKQLYKTIKKIDYALEIYLDKQMTDSNTKNLASMVMMLNYNDEKYVAKLHRKYGYLIANGHLAVKYPEIIFQSTAQYKQHVLGNILDIVCTHNKNITGDILFKHVIVYVMNRDKSGYSYYFKHNITPIHVGYLNRYCKIEKYDLLNKIKPKYNFVIPEIHKLFKYYDKYYDLVKQKFSCDPVINYTDVQFITTLLLIFKHSPFRQHSKDIIKLLLGNCFTIGV